MSYSTFINGLKKAGNGLDRKILADIAANDAAGFAALAVQSKAALEAAKSARAAAEVSQHRICRRGTATAVPLLLL